MAGSDLAGFTDEELAAKGMAVAANARRSPDAPAIISPNGNRTWAELNARANQVARFFRSRGLKPGDAVALLAHNSPEFVEVWSACQRSGLRFTAVNWHQSPEIVAYVVDNCDAKALVASARFATAALESAKLAKGLDVKLSYAGAIDGFEDYDAAIGGESGENIPDFEPGSTMLYTSGTTGRPKGVFRPTRPVVSQLTAVSNETAKWNPKTDACLVTGPLYHAAPLGLNLQLPVVAGVTVVLMDKWDAEDTLRQIEKYKITHTHVVPTMFHRMLQLPEAARTKYDTSSMRWILHGAAPCPAHVKKAAMDWFGPVIYEYFSATEGGGVFIGPHDWLRKAGSVGKPVAGVGIRLLDAEGKDVPAGTEGIIYTQAPATGRFEYYKDPTKTTQAYRGEWFTLGDMGRFDDEGFLFLTGRTAELIISGGVNIYPVEIDEVIIGHEAVADAAVVGVPNEDWGEEIKAVVELKPGYAADEATRQSILDYAKEKLPGFQRPRTVDFVETLPRSPAGKVLRAQVRAPFWVGRSKSI